MNQPTQFAIRGLLRGVKELRNNLYIPNFKDIVASVGTFVGLILLMTLFVNSVDSLMLFVIAVASKRPV